MVEAVPIDEDLLLAAVEEAISDRLDHAPQWIVEPIDEAPVVSATKGIWRIRSVADDSAPQWSFVLKALHHASSGHRFWRSSDESVDPMYWRREALFYETDLLADADADVRAPHCYSVDWRDDGTCHLWLEDVTGEPASEWPLSRFNVAARHLGRTQAQMRPDPDARLPEWFSRQWLRSYVERRAVDFLPLPPALWRHPLIERSYPADLTDYVQGQWAQRRRTLDVLESLPQTVCHHDVWPRNLFADDSGDVVQTVMIDWSFVGLGAIGEDIGNFIPDSMLDMFVDSRVHGRELAETIFDGYVEGLRDGGWDRDPAEVRYAMTATAALKYAWVVPRMLLQAGDAESLADMEESLGTPIEDIYARRAATAMLLSEFAEEARELRATLWPDRS